jgi:hypothetical protein
MQEDTIGLKNAVNGLILFFFAGSRLKQMKAPARCGL